ncbi:hypothetical protein E8E13_003883 [Curvularia kusanoi]|uniref:F-box domain-containing protein n=1 Tax=Curvularia kusanoi TaxID=90978 RepID=A0A9P4WAU3_CURKU|nr:hypothetical protein E8E13_003883 [Curvularia kusanoi]
MTEAQNKLVRRLEDDVDDQVRKRRKVQPDEDNDGTEAVHDKRTKKANQQDCRLLKLPGELRNRIYGYLTDEPNHRHRFRTYNFIGQVTVVLPIECKALSQTSRQMREEIRSYALKHGGLRITWEELAINKSFKINARGESLIIRDIEVDITALSIHIPSRSIDDKMITRGRGDPLIAGLWLYDRLSPLIKDFSLKYVSLKVAYEADAWEVCFLSGFVYPGPVLVSILGNMMLGEPGKHIQVHADIQSKPCGYTPEWAEIENDEGNEHDIEESGVEHDE